MILPYALTLLTMILNLKSLRMIRTVLLQYQQGTIMMMIIPIALIMLHHTHRVDYGLSLSSLANIMLL